MLWSEAIAAGIPDELFWGLTVGEVNEVIRRRIDQERAAFLRAGLITSAIYNTHLKKGARKFKPTDFVREERRESDYMTVEQSIKALDAWAKRESRQTVRKEKKT